MLMNSLIDHLLYCPRSRVFFTFVHPALVLYAADGPGAVTVSPAPTSMVDLSVILGYASELWALGIRAETVYLNANQEQNVSIGIQADDVV